ncbi:hypothetical protein CORC01_03638 [Colletotrichum orchidophilum]|uniref:Glycosyltransferase 2-like domain-containing protein n=1 Tax=Colletotrichum orchidophilum TaxID=1209926 RepID=A0A1G4BI44_9PEZI|nr:uncharacterized protein CORC01_03638 [Colletotrichum orchidophilum]OHF01071.1 hypothetical protein CORC01_03638 [Colletotrichum orchidophilum]
MMTSCFRVAVGRLVASGTILTFMTFQYIAIKSKPQMSYSQLLLQLSSCILLCNFLVVIARWADYEPIQGLKDNDRLPKINVIIPAYNESEFVRNSIQSALSSDYPREKMHIIVVDDGSTDDTWSHIQQSFPSKSSTQHTIIRHEVNRGKRQAMVTAFAVVKNEILVTLDSDTILDKHTLRNLVSPFVLDSDIGGVAGHLSVFNIQSQGWDSFIPRILDCLFEQNGNIPRAAQSKHGFITILPGAISAFRRDAILPHTQALVDTRFLGRPMRHGEDVQLTMGLLRDGWRLKYQSNAVGYTVAPETFLKAFLISSRLAPSDTEHDDLLEARQKISTVLRASSSSGGLRPQYTWSSLVDCTVRNGCVEKLTVNGQRLVLWDIKSEEIGNNTDTMLLLNKLQTANPRQDSFLVPVRGVRQENIHNIGDLLDGLIEKGFRPVTVGDCIEDPKHFWYLDHLGHPTKSMKIGNEAADSPGIFLTQVRWGGVLAVIFLELMALSCLFWAVCQYRKIKSHQRIVQ